MLSVCSGIYSTFKTLAVLLAFAWPRGAFTAASSLCTVSCGPKLLRMVVSPSVAIACTPNNPSVALSAMT